MENKPQIPTLKESQNEKKGGAPVLKIRGLQSGLSLMERLKQFKKKDLAFILAGLGVLFMAPLAEHFMMSPNDQGGDTMTPGFSSGKAGSPFGNGSSPYEPGISGLAPGGTVGNGSDVITPLNVRDPSALVMGPGQTQQAPATASQPSAAPPPPPPSKDDSKWNDAIAAGKAAASAATKKAALPVPHVPLSAGGLRGLGAVSGGSGSSFSLPAITSNGLASGHVNQSNGLTGTNGSGFKGVARGPNTGGTGNLEKLKQAAASAGGEFNRAGSAQTALEQAANRDMGGGSGSGGAGEGGHNDDKATSGSQNKDSKSPGESLEFLRQKMQMEKDIAFADELRKNDPSCLFDMSKPCMERNKIFSQGEETLISKGLVEPIAGVMGDMLKGWLEPDSAGQVTCCKSDDKGTIAAGASCMASMKKPGACGKAQDSSKGPTGGFCLLNGFLSADNGSTTNGYFCLGGGSDGSAPQNKAQPGADGAPQGPVSASGPIQSGGPMDSMCQGINAAMASNGGSSGGDGGVAAKEVKGTNLDPVRPQALAALKKAAGDLSDLRQTAGGEAADGTSCGAGASAPLYQTGKSLKDRLDASKKAIRQLGANYKQKVLVGDDKRVQGMLNMERDAYGILHPKLDGWKSNVDGMTADEIKSVYGQAEEKFAGAEQVGKEESGVDADPWSTLPDKLAQQRKELGADLKAQDDSIAGLMQKMAGRADTIKSETDAAVNLQGIDRRTVKDLQMFKDQIDAGAKHWKDAVTGGVAGIGDGDYVNQWKEQDKAITALDKALKDQFKTQHTDAMALVGAQPAGQNAPAPTAKGIATIGSMPQMSLDGGAPAAQGGAQSGAQQTYRDQVKQAFSTFYTQAAQLDQQEKTAQQSAPQTYQKLKQADDKVRLSLAQQAADAVAQAHGKVADSRDPYETASTKAGNTITSDIEPHLAPGALGATDTADPVPNGK